MARFADLPEAQKQVIQDSTLLAVDTSEVLVLVHLGTLGLTGVQFSQGLVGGGVPDGGVSPSDGQPPQYAAMCTAVVHDPALYSYVQPNGVWVGDLRNDLEQAQFDVSAHDDLQAFLCISVGTNLMGPYTPGGPV